ncbi:MAG: hypothetical protein KC609_21585 [Myxococcales bacterium]|nr:hypothetical protein [Myxococcales bacterium]
MREMMANRNTNKALLVVALAIGMVLSSFAVMVEKKPDATAPEKQSVQTYINDVGIQTAELGQYHRQMYSLHSLGYQSFVREPLRLADPYRILNRVEANSSKTPTYKVFLRPNVYQFDQLHDLALSLAKDHPGQTVRVKFWTSMNRVDKGLEDYGFTIQKQGKETRVNYDYNI